MALEIIFAFSYLGFIIIPPISITTMHLLVMIAAMILGTRESVAVSLVFAPVSYTHLEKKLAILKDPHCGAFAVIRLCGYFEMCIRDRPYTPQC